MTRRPRKGLTVYVCGVRPYDSGHMGHAFTFSIFDVLIRFLEANGTRVKYVQNVTDVDDPLFERARRDGVDGHAQLGESDGHRAGQRRQCRLRGRIGRAGERMHGVRVNYAESYWTPPMTPKLAYDLEKKQIENLGVKAMVSISVLG